MDRYFDYASATPMDSSVVTAMRPYFTEMFYNPSALYSPARQARVALQQARADVADSLGAKQTEIIWTAGATEANNLAITGVMHHYPGAHVIFSAIEHDSVREPAVIHNGREVAVDEAGRLDLETLVTAIDDQTVLVSIIMASNEIGVIQPMRQIAEIVQQIRKSRIEAGNQLPLYLHTDATQAVNYIDAHCSRLGVDLMTLNAGKIYGPKQIGVLYVKSGVQLDPIVLGGGQERGLRSGTENVAGAVGMAAALQMATDLRKVEADRLFTLQHIGYNMLAELIPSAIINGSQKHRLPNNIHITLPGQDNERLQILLDKAGFCVATGSACSASSDEPSPVLRALGLSDESIRASLRITMGRHTTEASLSALIHELRAALA